MLYRNPEYVYSFLDEWNRIIGRVHRMSQSNCINTKYFSFGERQAHRFSESNYDFLFNRRIQHSKTQKPFYLIQNSLIQTLNSK